MSGVVSLKEFFRGEIPGYLTDLRLAQKITADRIGSELEYCDVLRPKLTAPVGGALERQGLSWRRIANKFTGYKNGQPLTSGHSNEKQVVGSLGTCLRKLNNKLDVRVLVSHCKEEYGMSLYDDEGYYDGEDIFVNLFHGVTYCGKKVGEVMDQLYKCVDNFEEEMTDLPPVTVIEAIQVLDKTRKERKVDIRKDNMSKKYMAALKSENNTISKFSHTGCRSVLHLGSGGANCLSRYSFPGSVVRNVDPVIDGVGVEDIPESDVRKYDCVVSDMCVYDKGGLNDETNDLVENLLGKVSEKQHLIVKVCLAKDYPPLIAGIKWKLKKKLRLHNREMILERSKKNGDSIYTISNRVAQIVYHANKLRQAVYLHGVDRFETHRKPVRYKLFFPHVQPDYTKGKGYLISVEMLEMAFEKYGEIEPGAVVEYAMRVGTRKAKKEIEETA